MILYKYMSFKAACSVIDSSSIGFSCIEDLNDPFEGAPLCFDERGEVSSKVQHDAFKNRLSRKYGVLSLTRNPLNALMWSHYGDDHRGVVIGIDIEVAELNDTATCVIPARLGEVVYTATMPSNYIASPPVSALMSIGDEFGSFIDHQYDIFKNTFLYKDYAWGYEEEVRVVKNVNTLEDISRYCECDFSNASGNWHQIQVYGRPLYCLKMPRESIVEAYLGSASYSNVTRLGLDENEYVKIRSTWKSLGIKTYLIKREDTNWGLEVSSFEIE